MLIYLIGSLLLGALQAMRSAAEAGCVLNYLRNAGPVWIADLRLVAARSCRALARTIAAAAFATLAQKRTPFQTNNVLNNAGVVKWSSQNAKIAATKTSSIRAGDRNHATNRLHRGAQ